MILRKTILMISGAFILTLQACNSDLKSSPPSPEVNDLASTIVAMTFQAATRSASQKLSAIASIPAATPTSSPTLYINNNVPCRSGTKSNFKVIATFLPGTTLDILAKYSVDSAWLVKVPNSPGTCWVLAQDGSPGGSYDSVPEVTPLPSTQKAPAMPATISWPFICSYVQGDVYQVKINLSWSSLANDANGYRLYRFDTQIADLPASNTSFTDTTNVNQGSQLTYSVVAYNDVGVSPPKSVTINSICKLPAKP
jgi:hypothetical protein